MVVWRLAAPEEYVVAPPSAPGREAEADPTGAQAALRRLETLVEKGQTSDPGQSEAVTAVLENARALRLEEFGARYVSESGPVSAQGAWTASVDLTWRFAGFDQRAVRQTVDVSFGRTDGAVRITGFGGGSNRTPVWLTGRTEVRRSPEALVVVRGDATAADRYLALARDGVQDVRQVLPWPRPRLVLEVAADRRGFEAALGAEPGSYAGVAAVTVSVDGTTGPRAPVHVYVNPAVIGKLTGRGAEVVVSHEATHVATRAATAMPTSSTMPMWLLEGFADYVALRDVDLPLSTTAGQVLEEVRTEGAPDRLPGKADFDAGSDSFGAEYEAAWLACLVLADDAGQDALVAVHQEVLAGAPLETSLRRHAGYGVAGLTERWQQRLEEWAG